MNDALHMAASGMSVVARMVDNSARNAANAGTPGYLSRVMATRGFRTELDRILGREASLLRATEHTSFKQGNVVSSDEPLHVALLGPGFMAVQGPSQVHYTRNGSLTLAPDGTLSTQAGYPVLGVAGPIRADTSAGREVHIAEGGRVYQGQQLLGTLKLTEFEKPHLLKRTAETLFLATPDAGARVAEGTQVVPRHLELSAETSVISMVHMIEASKSFEAQQRVIRSISASYENLIRNLR